MAKTNVKSRIPAPKTRWERYVQRPIVYDFGVAWFALMAGFGTSIRAFAGTNAADYVAGWCYVIGSLGIAIIAGCKFWVQWTQQEQDDSSHDLEGCLFVLHTLLRVAYPHVVEMRFTIHVYRSNRKQFIQALDYVGEGETDGTAGRVTNSSAGIIGMALREKRCIAASRKTENYQEYLRDLTTNWGFSLKEARKRYPAAMAWVAIPVGDVACPDGILYGDCSEMGFFDDPDVLQLVSGCAVAISNYLDLRY